MFIKNKRRYILTKLDENKDDPRQFWYEMDTNLKVGKSKSNIVCTRIKDETGKIVTGDRVLETINKFYVSIGPTLAEKFPRTNILVYDDIDIRGR